MDRGFDESIKHGGASIYQTPDYWNNDYQDDYYEHNGVMKQYKGYCTDVWFDEAKKFILESKKIEKPFFIYLPTNTPHGPNIVHEKYSNEYYDALKKGYRQVPEFDSHEDQSKSISWFYGMIFNLDDNIGKLDNFLKDNDLFDNTILVFMTDNGGTGGVNVFNAGMRGKKTSLYDDGHRLLFFIRWPKGGFYQHKKVVQLTQSKDLFPILIDLYNLSTSQMDFDGVSLMPVMENNNRQLKDRIVVMQNAQASLPKKYHATVLWNDWRLVANTELYNIQTDSAQQKDIAHKYPDVVKQMQQHYEKWWQSVQESLTKVPTFPVGGSDCEKIDLTCFDWHGFEGAGNITVQPTIRRGPSANGVWNIEVLEDGEYQIKCSRWPEEASTPIRAGLPKHETMTIFLPPLRLILRLENIS